MTVQGLRLWLRLWLSAAVASAVALAVVALAVASNEVLTVRGFSSVPRRVVSCGVSSSRLLWRLVESSLVVSRPSVVVLFCGGGVIRFDVDGCRCRCGCRLVDIGCDGRRLVL